MVPLVSALSEAAVAHPLSEILISHKHRSDKTDLQLMKALSDAGFKVQRVEAREADTGSPFSNLLLKFPSVTVYRLQFIG